MHKAFLKQPHPNDNDIVWGTPHKSIDEEDQGSRRRITPSRGRVPNTVAVPTLSRGWREEHLTPDDAI